MDTAGSRGGAVEANGDRLTWSYDDAYQLTRERRSGANGYDATYSYDPVGNRLTKLEGGTTVSYSYDAANQLSAEDAGGARTTYSYDANGNTTVVNADGSLTTYTWDVENRAVGVELPDDTLNTMSDDGDGKRRRYEDSGGARIFLWDGENVPRQTDSGGTTNRRYTIRPMGFGELISQDDSFHHYDGLGNTDRITNPYALVGRDGGRRPSHASEVDQVAYCYRAFGEQTVRQHGQVS